MIWEFMEDGGFKTTFILSSFLSLVVASPTTYIHGV